MLDIDQWIELLGTLYDRWGYLIVFLGSLFENTALLGLFLPGASLALLGAFYAQQGTLQLGWVIFFAWAGTVLGYHADYLLGRLLLTRLLGRWGDSWLGRRLRPPARARLGGRFLARHGGKAILLSHLLGHLRSFVALSARATPLRYRRFLAFYLAAVLLSVSRRPDPPPPGRREGRGGPGPWTGAPDPWAQMRIVGLPPPQRHISPLGVAGRSCPRHGHPPHLEHPLPRGVPEE